MKDPAILFYYDTWLTATAEMDADVRSWYLDLLIHQYDKGSLPNDDEKLASLARVKISQFNKFKQINKYLEFIKQATTQLNTNKQITILDFGSGKSYLTFSPGSILSPSVKMMASLLILVLSLTYYLSISKVIQKNGFQLPDSLIDSALRLTAAPQAAQQNQTKTSLPQINTEQLDLLKQSGLDPSILDSLSQTTESSKAPDNLMQDTLKQALNTQLDSIIKPYLGFIPAILAVLFFFLLQSLTSILNLLIYPLLWIIFYILEKTGFIKFTEEQRTVRKMVV